MYHSSAWRFLAAVSPHRRAFLHVNKWQFKEIRKCVRAHCDVSGLIGFYDGDVSGRLVYYDDVSGRLGYYKMTSAGDLGTIRAIVLL